MASGGRLWRVPAIVASILLTVALVLYVGMAYQAGTVVIPNADLAVLATLVCVVATLVASSANPWASLIGAITGVSAVVVIFAVGRSHIPTPPNTSDISMLGPGLAQTILGVFALFAGLVCVIALVSNVVPMMSEWRSRDRA